MPVALLLFIAAAAPAPPRIGIFDLKCADPTLADSAMDVLAAAVAELRQGEVVTRSDLAAMVGAQKLQDALGCDDVGCLTDIGNAAGVERLVTGSVDLTDPGLVVSLKVLSLRQARVENRVTVRSSAGRRQLPDVLGVAAELLLVPEAARAPGVLSLRGGPAGLTATVLGKTHETSPVELPPGVYDVELRARGHAPALRSAAVRAGKVTILDATLSPRQDHRTWGALLGIEAATPRGVGFHSNRAGFGVDAGFWMDLRWLAILPRLAVRYGPPGGDDALYVDGALDLGVYWLPLDRGITPLVGFGLGGRYLYTRDPTRTDTFGSVLTVTHEVVPTDSRLGLAGYGRVGALFFRDTSAPFVVALDWSIASFGEHDRPQAFQLSLGVVL